MRALTLLVALALVAITVTSCGGGSSGSGSSSEGTTAKAAAEALTAGLMIANAKLKAGGIPTSTDDKVMLTQSDPPISMTPGSSTLMTLDADNPDESSDAVESTLMQFMDSSMHFEVPRGTGKADGGAGGSQGIAHLDADMSLDMTACDNLCNKKYPLKMLQAVVLHSGKVSKMLMRDFEMDCTKDGDSKKCGGSSTSSTSKTDAGRSGTGGTSAAKDAGTSSMTSAAGAQLATEIASDFAMLDQAACRCATPPSTMTYCSTAPYSMSQIKCISDAIMAAGDAAGPAANCWGPAIKSVAGSCGSGCTCTQAAVESAAMSCMKLPGAGSGSCMPATSSDAGTRSPDAGH